MIAEIFSKFMAVFEKVPSTMGHVNVCCVLCKLPVLCTCLHYIDDCYEELLAETDSTVIVTNDKCRLLYWCNNYYNINCKF